MNLTIIKTSNPMHAEETPDFQSSIRRRRRTKNQSINNHHVHVRKRGEGVKMDFFFTGACVWMDPPRVMKCKRG